MLRLSKNQNIALIFMLSAIMWLTRGHHFASLSQLPDASWAIFFIAGFYFSSFAVIGLILAQAFLIDYYGERTVRPLYIYIYYLVRYNSTGVKNLEAFHLYTDQVNNLMGIYF